MKKWEQLTKEEQDYWNEGAKSIPRTPIIENLLELVQVHKKLKCYKHGYEKISTVSEENQKVILNGAWVAHLKITHGYQSRFNPEI